MTAETVTGVCLCGAVAYAADGPFGGFQYCHCSRCRAFSGSAHSANLFCPPGQFRFTQGADNVQTFALPNARHFATAFCKTCGSSLPWTNQSGSMTIIPAGTLHTAPSIRPSTNIMFGSGAPWYVSASELPSHDGFPPRK